MKLIRKNSNKISKDYSPSERAAITQDVVDFIRKRTDKGLDKNNKPFPGYSKSYKTSNEFKEAGKSGKVNLKLSHDMMNDLDGLNSKNGEIVYGYESSSDQLGKVTGNILGTYGNKSALRGKKRDFLGISRTDLNNILSNYPLKDKDARANRTILINALSMLSEIEAKKQASQMVVEGLITREAVEAYFEE